MTDLQEMKAYATQNGLEFHSTANTEFMEKLFRDNGIALGAPTLQKAADDKSDRIDIDRLSRRLEDLKESYAEHFEEFTGDTKKEIADNKRMRAKVDKTLRTLTQDAEAHEGFKIQLIKWKHVKRRSSDGERWFWYEYESRTANKDCILINPEGVKIWRYAEPEGEYKFKLAQGQDSQGNNKYLVFIPESKPPEDMLTGEEARAYELEGKIPVEMLKGKKNLERVLMVELNSKQFKLYFQDLA